jgi:class 3 adenylate cyclase
MRTSEDYETEIAALKAELERLRGGAAMMTVAGAQPVTTQGTRFTIQGLEEMILVVDEKREIAYLNDRMARLLGITPDKRREVLGSKLIDWERGPLGDVLSTLIAAVRESGRSYVVDREMPELGPDRLPSLAERNVKDPPLLRFVCTLVKEKVQIVAQDVTHTNWLTKNFSRYVSPRVIEQMQTVSEEALMKTDKRVASVLFADLRGFTRACQELQPDQVVDMVNSFLAHAVAAVEKFDGMVDKFMGDEIMAIFGVPLPTADHALRALMAATAIIKSHQEWQAERASRGLTAPGVGIGIATGEVVVGNIGTSSRLDFTVLGNNVNLAARLCGKAESNQILIVRDTHHLAREGMNFYQGSESVPRFHFDVKGTMEFKNILKPIEVIAVSV